MDEKIVKVECFMLGIPRDTPYLGALGPEDVVTKGGCFVRAGNSGIYSLRDHSLLVKVTSQSGAYGWGECVTVVAPQVAASIVEQILEPLALNKNTMDVVQITEGMYDAMRLRGFFGGFYQDAIAAVDIALWDLKGKLLGVPVCQLLGGERHKKIKAYVSGLPVPTQAERADLARAFQDRGFDAVKVPIIVNLAHPEREVESLRRALGDEAKILVDMHWKYSALEAIKVIGRMDEFDLYVAEAPCNAEDMEGQAQVAASVRTNVAIGEELRTVYEYKPRFVGRCMNIIQPEMGRMGVTQFWQVCQMARAFHQGVMPHGSIGIGVFLAASLQVSAACSQFISHEYQHSIVDKNLRYLKGNLAVGEGYLALPDGPGLGVEPNLETLEPYIMK